MMTVACSPVSAPSGEQSSQNPADEAEGKEKYPGKDIGGYVRFDDFPGLGTNYQDDDEGDGT